jgi:antitoxin component of MazEF toxin-antitoxin module
MVIRYSKTIRLQTMKRSGQTPQPFIYLPRTITDELHIEKGDELRVYSPQEGVILIVDEKRAVKGLDLQQLTTEARMQAEADALTDKECEVMVRQFKEQRDEQHEEKHTALGDDK